MATDARRLTFFGLLVIALVIGILLGFLLDSGDADNPPPSTAAPPRGEGPGPTDEVNGLRSGYARTEAGAIAAATNFSLLSGRDDLLDLDALTRAKRTLAAPAWEEEAAEQAENGYEYIVNTYGKDADVSASVLRYDVMEFTSQRASVRLWTVSVASGSKRPNVEEVWATVSVDLVWIDGDWRVQGTESDLGPAPVDLPSGQPEETAAKLMEEFDEFGGAPLP